MKWTTPPRVFTIRPVLGGDERLPGGPPGAVGERRRDRLAPAGAGDRVRVEEDEEVAERTRSAAVAGGGKALVRGARNHARAGAASSTTSQRLVAGRVVDHDQLVALAKLRRQRLERRAHLLALAVGDDDDGDGWRVPVESRRLKLRARLELAGR